MASSAIQKKQNSDQTVLVNLKSLPAATICLRWLQKKHFPKATTGEMYAAIFVAALMVPEHISEAINSLAVYLDEEGLRNHPRIAAAVVADRINSGMRRMK